ncbi:alpha-E domain-containing protein [Nigerium massiliense]|uniref:alpha-E domain-containing protein n=1 Tax=Nigerium massiliense TaxID=1522317 RepID=UPI00058DBB04|nr:alpha-E domain-containing protein [Nigerium massiliense]
MLSRIAESLYWIGRYLERAEDTCRSVDVHLQLLIDDPLVDQASAARSLLTVMGAPEPEPSANIESEVLRLLCFDDGSPSSIVTAIGGAREAARRARETVSAEMWEAINTTWNSARGGRLQRMRPSNMFRMVKERCAVIAGISDNTMSHDEGWHFLVLGRNLERADMTARLLTTIAASSGSQVAWANVLRGCGAYHAFVRTYGGNTNDREAAEFLMLDRLFPRSLVYTLAAGERALAELDQGERRTGFESEAQRQLGRARMALEYQRPSEVLEDLPSRMAQLQATLNQAGTEISRRYFEGAAPALWRGGSR